MHVTINYTQPYDILHTYMCICYTYVCMYVYIYIYMYIMYCRFRWLRNIYIYIYIYIYTNELLYDTSAGGPRAAYDIKYYLLAIILHNVKLY